MATRADLLAAKRLQAIADAAEPAVREQVAWALEQLQGEFGAAELERILRAGDAVALHDATASLPLKLRPAVKTLETVVRRVARAEAASANITSSMNLIDQAAIRAARSGAATLVTNITAETRAGIRELVARAFAQGIPPRDLAKLLQPLVGVNSRQARAVMAYRAELIGDGLSRGAAAVRSTQYAQRLIKKRAVMIARTETIGAATRGQLATWNELLRLGKLSGSVVKVWIVTPDDRLCKWCRSLEDRALPLAGSFASGRGVVQGPPLHPNCRCALAMRANVKAQVVRRAA